MYLFKVVRQNIIITQTMSVTCSVERIRINKLAMKIFEWKKRKNVLVPSKTYKIFRAEAGRHAPLLRRRLSSRVYDHARPGRRVKYSNKNMPIPLRYSNTPSIFTYPANCLKRFPKIIFCTTKSNGHSTI